MSKKTFILCLLYLSAIVLANLVIGHYGPKPFVIFITSSSLIGLDLTSRDTLHDAWHNKHLKLKMLILILLGSLISYLLNQNVKQIAIASSMAFIMAATVDTLIYMFLYQRTKFVKSNYSNIVSAAVDSYMFPLLAFGTPILWSIVLIQFASKVIGGYVWSVILQRTLWK